MSPLPKRVLLALTTLALVAAALPGVAAHESNNHGTIKVHDEREVSPPQQNDPHVSCEFFIEGFNMADDSGHLEFYAIPPTENPPVLVLTDNWTGTAEDDGDGFHFVAGPYELPPGHYRVEAYLDQGHPGAEEHFAKTKTFWVNACPDEGRAPEVPCPPNVTATAEPDGDILLDWGPVENATQYRIYRAESGEDLESYAVVLATQTSFTDTDTDPGTTYRYQVTAVVGGFESEGCPVIEVTAIPFFPGIIGAGLAVAGAVGAIMLARRK